MITIVVIGIVVITIVVIVLALGDQRITMRLQRRVELRRVGVTEFDPVAAERLVGGLGDRRPRLGGGFGFGLGVRVRGRGSSLRAVRSWLTVATAASAA